MHKGCLVLEHLRWFAQMAAGCRTAVSRTPGMIVYGWLLPTRATGTGAAGREL
jgi:hypothetical protein